MLSCKVLSDQDAPQCLPESPRLPQVRRRNLRIIKDISKYPLAIHLAAIRISQIITQAADKSRDIVQGLWKDEGVAICCKSENNQARARLAITMASHLPRDWKFGIHEKCISISIPDTLWPELVTCSDVQHLYLYLGEEFKSSGGSLCRLSENAFGISINLNPYQCWYLADPDWSHYCKCLMCHELTHIANYGSDLNEDFAHGGGQNPLYPFALHEIPAYAAGIATEWVSRFGDRPFAFADAVRQYPFYSHAMLAVFDSIPKGFSTILRGKDLEHWKVCFLRLVEKNRLLSIKAHALTS